MDFAVRLIASAALVAAGSLAGRSLAGAQKRRVEALSHLSGAVEALSHAMLNLRLPLSEALADPGCSAFGALSADLGAGVEPAEAWRVSYARLSARGGPLDALTPEDAEALSRLFASLGSGGSQAQKAVLSEAERSLQELGVKARKALNEQGRLYATLGALGGMATAVMLL